MQQTSYLTSVCKLHIIHHTASCMSTPHTQFHQGAHEKCSLMANSYKTCCWE